MWHGELRTALDILTPRKVFFLAQNGVVELQEELQAYKPQLKLEPGQCFTGAESGRLAEALLTKLQGT